METENDKVLFLSRKWEGFSPQSHSTLVKSFNTVDADINDVGLAMAGVNE